MSYFSQNNNSNSNINTSRSNSRGRGGVGSSNNNGPSIGIDHNTPFANHTQSAGTSSMEDSPFTMNQQQQQQQQQQHSTYLRSRPNAVSAPGAATVTTPSSTTSTTYTLPKIQSETSAGYTFGNSSVGTGGGSMIRPNVTYNPTATSNSNQHLHHQQQHILLNPSQSMTTAQSSSVLGSTTTGTGGGGGVSAAVLQTNLNLMNFCGICSVYDLKAETLEYNYALEQRQYINNTTNNNNNNQKSIGNSKQAVQSYPRIRSRGEYYIDTFNDEPWSWTMGTNEQNGTWCNSSDQAGTIMSAMVWILMLYSAFTVTALTITEGIPVTLGMLYAILVFMALASHAKTSFTDPGSVPVQAIPSERQRLLRDSHSMCGQCQTFKPPGSHHCRICNRCISRMDHHCPWMNNCVGAGNLKHFCLFLIYTWLCAAYSLTIFGWNYFFCSDEDCTFHPVVLHLVRLMTLLAIGAFLFTSSMLMNVCYGIMTGIGTIDRLKKKATNTMSQSDEEPIQLIDVFGIGGYWTWLLPIDPIFEEHDRVMGYTMPSRLDRERQFCELVAAQDAANLMNGIGVGSEKGPTYHGGTSSTSGGEQAAGCTIKPNTSMEFPSKCVNDLLPV